MNDLRNLLLSLYVVGMVAYFIWSVNKFWKEEEETVSIRGNHAGDEIWIFAGVFISAVVSWLWPLMVIYATWKYLSYKK